MTLFNTSICIEMNYFSELFNFPVFYTIFFNNFCTNCSNFTVRANANVVQSKLTFAHKCRDVCCAMFRFCIRCYLCAAEKRNRNEPHLKYCDVCSVNAMLTLCTQYCLYKAKKEKEQQIELV